MFRTLLRERSKTNSRTGTKCRKQQKAFMRKEKAEKFSLKQQIASTTNMHTIEHISMIADASLERGRGSIVKSKKKAPLNATAHNTH